MKQGYDLCEPDESSHHVLQGSLTDTNTWLVIFVLLKV